MKKILLLILFIVFVLFNIKWDKQDKIEIDKITADCLENSNYSLNACKGYAFVLVKEGKDTLLHYSYTFKK